MQRRRRLAAVADAFFDHPTVLTDKLGKDEGNALERCFVRRSLVKVGIRAWRSGKDALEQRAIQEAVEYQVIACFRAKVRRRVNAAVMEEIQLALTVLETLIVQMDVSLGVGEDWQMEAHDVIGAERVGGDGVFLMGRKAGLCAHAVQAEISQAVAEERGETLERGELREDELLFADIAAIAVIAAGVVAAPGTVEKAVLAHLPARARPIGDVIARRHIRGASGVDDEGRFFLDLREPCGGQAAKTQRFDAAAMLIGIPEAAHEFWVFPRVNTPVPLSSLSQRPQRGDVSAYVKLSWWPSARALHDGAFGFLNGSHIQHAQENLRLLSTRDGAAIVENEARHTRDAEAVHAGIFGVDRVEVVFA